MAIAGYLGEPSPLAPLNLTLAEQLKAAVKAAKDKPHIEAWEKAQSYVLAQAGKGFESCTLPPVKDKSTAFYIKEKFIKEGVQCNVHSDLETYLISVIW